MKRYPIPAEEIRCEMLVANSRFITTLAPVFSVEEAKSFFGRVRREFADASHNVPLFLIGSGESVVEHCSDDGEPSGTAGRPALAVLRGSGLGDVAVVITRYFGGTKLGTGGLVRAYSDAVRMAVTTVPHAEKVPAATVMLELPYRLLKRLRLLVPAHHGILLDETFAAEITLTARFPLEDLDDFQGALRELSNGMLQAVVVDTADMILRS